MPEYLLKARNGKEKVITAEDPSSAVEKSPIDFGLPEVYLLEGGMTIPIHDIHDETTGVMYGW